MKIDNNLEETILNFDFVKFGIHVEVKNSQTERDPE